MTRTPRLPCERAWRLGLDRLMGWVRLQGWRLQAWALHALPIESALKLNLYPTLHSIDAGPYALQGWDAAGCLGQGWRLNRPMLRVVLSRLLTMSALHPASRLRIFPVKRCRSMASSGCALWQTGGRTWWWVAVGVASCLLFQQLWVSPPGTQLPIASPALHHLPPLTLHPAAPGMAGNA